MPIAAAPVWVSSPVLWVALIPLAFLALLFGVALKERRLVRPYVDLAVERPAEMPEASQASAYVAMMSGDLAAAGFEFGGCVAHAKVPRIRIVAAVWWSPARNILALSGSGTVMNVRAYQTWLISPLADGRWLVTTDNNDEGDPPRLYVIKRLLNMPASRLLEEHLMRMGQLGGAVVRFEEKTAIEALMKMYQCRVETMIARGLATYYDAEQNAWHYTPRGAVLVVAEFFRQLAGAIKQAARVNKRPIASTNLMPGGSNLLGQYAQVTRGGHSGTSLNGISALRSAGGKNGGGVYFEPLKKNRADDSARGCAAVGYVLASAERQHLNGVFLRINDPVLWYARVSIICTLGDVIALWLLGADNFHDEVGAIPVFVADARCVLLQHENHIRLPVLALAKPNAQRCEEHFPEVARLREVQQQADEEPHDQLVFGCRHRQNLDVSVAELD